MTKRKIIKIDESKCNGCSLCLPNCPEGAIQVIDGKARLISDLFCDGLGACLGHCPQGAICVEERQARDYDEKKDKPAPCACPGSAVMDFRALTQADNLDKAVKQESALQQWPVQLELVPVSAPFLNNSELLVAADCVPFAYADFHRDLLKSKALLIVCPKLDDSDSYKEKIEQIIRDNDIKSIVYAHMEVPCCFGLAGIIKQALADTGKEDVPFSEAVIGIKGNRIK